MAATKATMMRIGVGIVVLGLALGITPSVGADDDDDVEYGAYIYEGTCDDDPGANARFDIGDLEDDDENEIAGTSTTGPVYEEDEDISATVDELTASPHVVIVRQRDDQSAPIIACGEITGEVVNGRLQIDLSPVGDSGISGVALFEPNDDDDDDDDPTEVTVQVTSGGPAGTPAA